MTRKIKKLIFCTLLFQVYAINANAVFTDRVIVEINRVPYTQRSIEVYYMVKYGISRNKGAVKIDPNNWKDVVKEFVESMIIDQSNNALGLFRPNANAVQKANENFTSRIEELPAFKADVDRLALRHQELQRIIVQVFRIESSRQSKNAETNRRSDGAGARRGGNNATWFVKLRDKAVIRFYEQAAKYEPARWPE